MTRIDWFDRHAMPLFLSVTATVMVLHALGLVGPRWSLTCDGLPCGSLDGFASTIDIPQTTGPGMHRFTARRSGPSVMELSTDYSWPGAGSAELGFARMHASAHSSASIVALQGKLRPFAIELSGGQPPTFRLLVGNAVPRAWHPAQLRAATESATGSL